MDCGIFNVRTAVNACDCTRWCTDIVRKSALKVGFGRKKKKTLAPGNRNCVGDLSVRCSTSWATSPPLYTCSSFSSVPWRLLARCYILLCHRLCCLLESNRVRRWAYTQFSTGYTSSALRGRYCGRVLRGPKMAAAWRHLVASLNSLFKYVGPTRLVDSIDLGRNAVISRILSKSALRKIHTMNLLVSSLVLSS